MIRPGTATPKNYSTGETATRSPGSKHSRAHESFDDAFVADVEAEADAFTAAMRHSAVTYQSRSAVSVLDNVYAEPHTGIDRARVEFGAYVNSLSEEDLA